MKHNCCLLLLALTAFCTLAVSCSDPEESAASALARRIIPGKASRIEFARTADTSDVFTLSARKGKVVISAPNSNCMAVGLNYYLNNYCDATVSWYAADKVELPAKLPLPEEPLRVEARVPERFFLNYCTFGYCGRTGKGSSTGWHSTASTVLWLSRVRKQSGRRYGEKWE